MPNWAKAEWLTSNEELLWRSGELFRWIKDGELKVRMMVLPDTFIDQDSPNAMYAKAGLDVKGIVAKVFEALGRDARGEVIKLKPAGLARDSR